MDINTLKTENPTAYAELLALAAAENKKAIAQKKKDAEAKKVIRDAELAKEKAELAKELAELGIGSLPESVRQVGLQEVTNADKKVISRRVYVNFEFDGVSHTINRSVPTKGMTDEVRAATIANAKIKIVQTVLSILTTEVKKEVAE